MTEPIKHLFNGSAPIYLRIVGLAFQGFIVAGVFWVGATFERKEHFESYRIEQEIKRVEELRAIGQVSETMARIDERLKNAELRNAERNKR